MQLRISCSLAAVALLALATTPCSGQETLVIVGGDGQVLGPVIDAAPVTATASDRINQFTFVYRQGPNVVLLRTDSSGTVRSVFGENSARLYYTDVACAGVPAMATPADCCSTSVTPAVVLSGTALWRINYSIAPTEHLVAAYREVGASYERPCNVITPSNILGNPVESWGTFEFTPPLTLQLNPLIFNDGFGTGDITRW